jgi:triosephosphate isomerase
VNHQALNIPIKINMRKQIAAANWKMNLSYAEGVQLIDKLIAEGITPADHQQVLLAVPFPYLDMAGQKLAGMPGYAVAAQNCHQKASGAFTGEVSAPMLASMGLTYVVLGHSERREYFREDDALLAAKVDIALVNGLTPVFCCGEPLSIREADTQNAFVAQQLRNSLFHLSADQMAGIVIAYEPIWAIGTGRTASADQAQDMHAWLRAVIAEKYGADVAEQVSILYGGSVKGSNAVEIFSKPDVDGGLVGGASLDATDFGKIIRALK